MKTIIVLYRRANTGKTTTLNYLIGLLDKSKEEMQSLTKDRRVTISYGNKSIAVTTQGDNKYEIEENIKFFENEDCDILVTATRSRGQTTDGIYEYHKKINAKIIWIEKNLSVTLKDLINQAQAKDIQATIDTL
ncbi:hypothetical protein [Prevotella sp.]